MRYPQTMDDEPRSVSCRRPLRRLAPAALVAAVLVLASLATACGAHGAAGASATLPPAVSASPGAGPSPAASPAASSAAAPLPPRPHLVAHPQPVPILIYHHVLPKPKGPPLTYLSVKKFAGQLKYLASHGYQAVTMQRVYDAWTGKGILPPHPVVITFDDGYADQVRNAAPVLRRYHWPAELDLVFDALYLGLDAPHVSLTTEMVKGLLDDGWGLESHTVTHAVLTGLHGAKLRRELLVSRSRLEKTFDVPVNFFCYPGGIYSRRVKLAVRRAGYLAATGTRYGAATPRDLFSLPRIYCYGGESMAVFGARLRETLAAAGD